MKKTLDSVLVDVFAEIDNAMQNFSSFASAHEGYAVIKEEVDELWDAIKNNKHTSVADMHGEALQVAAMAIRFILDINDDNQGKES